MKKRIKKALLWALMVLLAAVLITGVVFGIQGYRLYRAALQEKPLEQTVAAVQNKASYVTMAELPAIYKDAVIAAEDHRYYAHKGVDPIGIARAVWVDISTWSLREGGSTITQQLAKNLYFLQNNSPARKIAEMLMAIRLEQDYGKEVVLDLYINSIYYGSGYYCIYDAANGYFGKEPAELSAYECTLLAGLPNAPSVYDPTVNPHLAEQRQGQVLDKMVRNGYLTEQEAKEIRDEKGS